jgi:hypothetical protein
VLTLTGVAVGTGLGVFGGAVVAVAVGGVVAVGTFGFGVGVGIWTAVVAVAVGGTAVAVAVAVGIGVAVGVFVGGGGGEPIGVGINVGGGGGVVAAANVVPLLCIAPATISVPTPRGNAMASIKRLFIQDSLRFVVLRVAWLPHDRYVPATSLSLRVCLAAQDTTRRPHPAGPHACRTKKESQPLSGSLHPPFRLRSAIRNHGFDLNGSIILASPVSVNDLFTLPSHNLHHPTRGQDTAAPP